MVNLRRKYHQERYQRLKAEDAWPDNTLYNKKWRSENIEHQRHYNLWNNCRDRARKKSIECTITLDDIQIPDKCPILGIKLVTGFASGRDNSPSVDRVKLSEGYTPTNTQVISNLANRMKNNATLEQCVLLGRWAEAKLAEVST